MLDIISKILSMIGTTVDWIPPSVPLFVFFIGVYRRWRRGKFDRDEKLKDYNPIKQPVERIHTREIRKRLNRNVFITTLICSVTLTYAAWQLNNIILSCVIVFSTAIAFTFIDIYIYMPWKLGENMLAFRSPQSQSVNLPPTIYYKSVNIELRCVDGKSYIEEKAIKTLFSLHRKSRVINDKRNQKIIGYIPILPFSRGIQTIPTQTASMMTIEIKIKTIKGRQNAFTIGVSCIPTHLSLNSLFKMIKYYDRIIELMEKKII